MAQDDVYHKIGRGGAGNYYAAGDKQPGANTAPKDLEAQKPAADDHAPTTSPVSLPSAPARAGRGGAGNYVDDTAGVADHERSVAQKTAAAVKQHPARATGLSGRGGAGNWKTDAAAREARRAEEERGRGEELERQAREAVDQGLKMPDKVHHAVEKTKA